MSISIRADAAIGAGLPLGNSFLPTAVPSSTDRDAFQLVAATRKDHAAIYRLLVAVFQGPSLAEFQAQLDAPSYDPCDRLLMTRGQEVAAHLHLVSRRIRLGGLELPTMDLRHLATLPEYRAHGLGTVLLDAAVDEMRRAGVVVATIRAKRPEFFRQRGWFAWNRFSYSIANPRTLLSVLERAERPAPRLGFSPTGERAADRKYTIQVWRRNELDSVASLYDQDQPHSVGDVCRLESEWKWLITREAYDRIYVICPEIKGGGSPPAATPGAGRQILGYGVVRDSRLVEFRTAGHDLHLARLLAARVCQDAVESGRSQLEVHAAPDDPIHDDLIAAGGSHFLNESADHRVLMAYVSRPLELLQFLKPELRLRAQQGGLAAGAELGIHTPTWQARLNIGARSLSIAAQPGSRHWIEASAATANQLLLGHLSPSEAELNGELRANSPEALAWAEVLFPALPLWRPTFDDLTA